MADINKIVLNDETLIDLTNDTVTEDDLPSGITAHDKMGKEITGTIPRVQYIASAVLSEPGWYRFARKPRRSNDAFIIDCQKYWNNGGATCAGVLFSLVPTTSLFSVTQLYAMKTSGADGVTAIRIVGDSSSLNKPLSVDFYYNSTGSNAVQVMITQLSHDAIYDEDDWILYNGKDVVKINDGDITGLPINAIEFNYNLRAIWAEAASCDQNGESIPATYMRRKLPGYGGNTEDEIIQSLTNAFNDTPILGAVIGQIWFGARVAEIIPSGNYMLTTYKTGEGNQGFQKLEGVSFDGTEFSTYVRTCYGGTWYDWKKVI